MRERPLIYETIKSFITTWPYHQVPKEKGRKSKPSINLTFWRQGQKHKVPISLRQQFCYSTDYKEKVGKPIKYFPLRNKNTQNFV